MEQQKETSAYQTKIFLVGMMGSGKSYWSKWLSKKFSHNFIFFQVIYNFVLTNQ
jgi:polynucleotide 5'-kinase involved in rRNA processing